MCIKTSYVGKQEVGIRRVQKRLPAIWHTYMKLVTNYQIPAINSCFEKCDEKLAYNATKNVHICSMCIKINKVGKQEVGI